MNCTERMFPGFAFPQKCGVPCCTLVQVLLVAVRLLLFIHLLVEARKAGSSPENGSGQDLRETVAVEVARRNEQNAVSTLVRLQEQTRRFWGRSLWFPRCLVEGIVDFF